MDKEINGLQKYLPQCIFDSLRLYDPVNEIRLHKNKSVAIVSGKRNIITGTICSENDFIEITDNICNHSLHSHADTIKNGYITADKYRIGVCGNMTGCNVNEITSLNIRIPHIILNVSDKLYNILKINNYRSSVLIYSPPSGGKTTMLRDLIVKLSVDKRISVIDSRNELFDSSVMTSPLLDIFGGYQKESAIEIATRTMSPEYIICDEIGSYNECETILSVQNTGVPFIATAHACNLDELLLRKNIKLLHDNMIFNYYIGLDRSDITVTKREEIENV